MALKVARILHAGYVFESGGVSIAFDPIFENPFSINCHAFPEVEFDIDQIKILQFSAVFISHYHDDHCSLDSLNLLNRNTRIYIYCIHDELFQMVRNLGFISVFSIEINRIIKVGPFEVIPRVALDADVDSIFHIKVEGLNILNVVDSWIDDDTLDILARATSWDLVLWPFQTMREIEVLAPSRAHEAPSEVPHEWLDQLGKLNPKVIVASSCQFKLEPWSWYNQAFFPISYAQFKIQIESKLPTAKVIRLNPGTSLLMGQNSFEMSSPLSWIKTIGNQNADYEYNSSLKPPGTSEIARQFNGLSISENERVLNYCSVELIEKYRVMDSSTGDYFTTRRKWRLSLFDHQGQVVHFDYLIDRNKMELSSEGEMPLGWLTEIPIQKLYAALEYGESLTSMYVRINDCTFLDEVEVQVAEADIMEDPLIRCLFTGVFGQYQKAQLRRLTGDNLR